MTTHDTFFDDAADGQQGDNPLRHLPLRDLELFCAHELQVLAEEGGIPNDHYPLELFRRAVVLREAGAWAVIYRQYAPFVLPWLLQLPQAQDLLEQAGAAVLAERAVTALATHLTPEKLARLGSQTALLKFFKVCVFALAADAQRSQHALEHTRFGAGQGAPALPAPDQGEESQGAARQLWQALLEEVGGEDEQRLCRLLFVQGMSAAEVCATSSECARFPDVETVNRMKGEILARLATSRRLHDLLSRLER
jgi:hypothetical protein